MASVAGQELLERHVRPRPRPLSTLPPPPPPRGKGGPELRRKVLSGVDAGTVPEGSKAMACPAGAGACLADSLQMHRFRNTGVQTIVTSRGEVEAAFAQIQTSRVRKANHEWYRVYPNIDQVSSGGADGEPGSAGAIEGSRQPRAVRFIDELVTPADGSNSVPLRLAEVRMLDVDEDLPRPSLLSLGAGVSKLYREVLYARLRALGTSSRPLLVEGHDPDEVWSAIKDFQYFETPTRVFRGGERLPAKTLGAVRFVCISDTHGKHEQETTQLPAGDVLLHAGDFSMTGTMEELQSFGCWLSSLPFHRKLVIAGNHDITLHEEYYRKHGKRRFHSTELDPMEVRKAFLESCDASVTYLEDETAVVSGVRVYGSPWQPEFCDWAFNLPRGPPIAQRWAAIPDDTDVLLVHGPPLGRGDRCAGGNRAGCADLLAAIQDRVRPEFCIYGHIHEGYGATFDGVTHYINASSCTHSYRCENSPLVFDVLPRGQG